MALERLNYVPGVGKPWKQQYQLNSVQDGDITGWIKGPELPRLLSGSQALVTKNRVYLLGGGDLKIGHTSNIYTARIKEDGTLSSWSVSGNLPLELGYSKVVVHKNKAYLMGGWSKNESISDVFSASINSDGTLGSWKKIGDLPIPLNATQAIVTKNRIFILGGDNGKNYVSTIYTTRINPDGSLDNWTEYGELPEAISDAQVVVTKNMVYMIGGDDGSVWSSNVYCSYIDTDGTLGNWSLVGKLPEGLAYSQAVVTKKRVYLLGGRNRTSWTSNVYTARIKEDGTLGAWEAGSSLPEGIGASQAVVTKGMVHLLGGYNASSLSCVYSAPISGGFNDYTNIN